MSMATKKSAPLKEDEVVAEVPELNYYTGGIRDLTAKLPLYSQIEQHLSEIERLSLIK